MYSLRRISDGAGDSGNMSLVLWKNENGQNQYEHGIPKIGTAVRVGSIYSRSFSTQDYWTTTIVTQILFDISFGSQRMIVFKTKNSEYIWEQY